MTDAPTPFLTPNPETDILDIRGQKWYDSVVGGDMPTDDSTTTNADRKKATVNHQPITHAHRVSSRDTALRPIGARALAAITSPPRCVSCRRAVALQPLPMVSRDETVDVCESCAPYVQAEDERNLRVIAQRYRERPHVLTVADLLILARNTPFGPLRMRIADRIAALQPKAVR